MKDFGDYAVASTDTVRTAMEKITRNKHRVVIVLDGRKVVGTVSDGDIRRAFLEDVLPIAPVEKIMNINCQKTMETNIQVQREIISQEKVTVLPIVNSKNELINIVLAHEPFFKEGGGGSVSR